VVIFSASVKAFMQVEKTQ